MPRNYLLKIFFIIHVIQISHQDVNDIIKKRNLHRPKEITQNHLVKISEMTDLAYFNKLLDNILVPRVVGTESHENVQNYIVDEMKKLNWNVELDAFKDKTPNLGELTFSNIIATLNPNAERFLILACHYDSKYFRNEEFLGATDSAVPCAMLISMAKTMSKFFDKLKDKNDLSIIMIFFDGEEAFEDWTATDSIYGARHLAEKWEKENFLHKIDVFVLLDLLGSPDPVFYSLYPETASWYSRLKISEDRLSHSNLLKSYTTSSISNTHPNAMFYDISIQAGIADDHLPFMRRGVPILHVIPVPFPPVWHKMNDDRSAICLTTVENLMKIFQVFVVEYLHLDLDE